MIRWNPRGGPGDQNIDDRSPSHADTPVPTSTGVDRSGYAAARALRKHRNWIAVALLLACHVTLSLTSTLSISETCDEVAHLTSGYSYWKTGDFRLVPEHPPFAQLWAAIPLLVSEPTMPTLEEPTWRVSDQWGFGKKFFYESGNDAATLLLQSRAMITIFAAATALAVFFVASRLFGRQAGFFSLALCVFSPTMLANASLVSTDMACGLLFLLSALGIWHVLQRVTLACVLLSGLALGALLLTKMSGVLIVPMAGMMVLVWLVAERPLHLTVGRRSIEFRSRWERLGMAIVLAGLHAVIAFGCIWAVFGLRYQAMRNPDPAIDHFDTFGTDRPFETSWEHELRELGRRGPWLQWVRDRRLLPEAYLYGFAYAVNMTRSRAAFLNGHKTARGFRTYFPFTFATKTTIPMLLIAVMSGVAFVRAKKLGESANRRSLFYSATPLVALLVIYWGFAITSHLNIGHRHMLPTYPPMFILCGALVAGVRNSSRGLRCAPWALATLHAASAVVAWPHYIAYFNELIGGPTEAYRHVVDSSLDWGQDLARLPERLDAAAANWVQEDGQPFTNVYLAYLCNAPPGYYGIKAINLPAKVNEPPPAMPLEAGIYCISATRLQQVYDIPISRWTPILEDAYQSCVNRVRAAQGMELLVGSELQNANPARDELSMRLRFARLCAALRQREPDDRAGYSILIYRMTEDEIQRALFGPPPELHADTPEGACEFAPSLVRAGDRDRAATILQWATETDPDYANARHWLGFALHQLGRRQEAVRQYVEALTLDPDTPGAYTNLGLCLAELGRLSEAIEMYRQAIRLEPLLPEARLNLGKALAAAGQCSDAIRAGQRAVELRSADPGLRTGLAEIRARCNPIEGSSSKRGMESGASAAVWPRQPGPTPCCLSR